MKIHRVFFFYTFVLMCCISALPPAIYGGDRLTEAQLKNTTYSGIYQKPATLVDGVYEGEPFEKGGASMPKVSFVDNTTVYGDLNGDGVEDAASLLEENSGGTGVFLYLGAQLNRGGLPVDAGSALIGDRIQVLSLAIRKNRIVADIVTSGPNESPCCGTQKERKTFAMKGRKLVKVGSELQGKVSLDDLMGSSWALTRIQRQQLPKTPQLPYPPLKEQQALPETTVTARFAHGQVSGSAGCNNYSASVSSDGAQKLTIGKIKSTRMFCSKPIMTQETLYLKTVENAAEWACFPGQLVLSCKFPDGSYATLFFKPAPAKI
jgi:heat shock protein HslJ